MLPFVRIVRTTALLALASLLLRAASDACSGNSYQRIGQRPRARSQWSACLACGGQSSRNGDNQSYAAQTDAQGRFRLPYLPVGEYRITAQADGFSQVSRELRLTIGSAFEITLQLPLLTASATVQVTGESPLIEENRSQIGQTVLQQEIVSLPYEGRNYLDLALLLPGVSPTNTASTQTLAETSEVVGQGYSVNSQRNFSNSFVVDGLSDNDDAAGVAGNVFSLDVVREFQGRHLRRTS